MSRSGGLLADLLLANSGIAVLIMFGPSVVAITRSVPKFDIEPISDRSERECKSAKTSTATKITFVNGRSELLVAYWPDWNGQRSMIDHRYELPPGEPIVVETYAEHYFVVVPAKDDQDRIAIVAARTTPSRLAL
jgi:hypothetical protein